MFLHDIALKSLVSCVIAMPKKNLVRIIYFIRKDSESLRRFIDEVVPLGCLENFVLDLSVMHLTKG